MKFVVLGLHILMMVIVLVVSARKSLTVHDFLLGGRKVGPWFSAFAYGTSYFSAVIIIGYAGKIGWAHGLSATWVGIANAILGNLLAWIVLAKRTHRMGVSLGVATMPGFFEKRYDSKALKIFSSILIFIFLVPYSASVYQGMGYLFQVALGIDFFWCILGIAALASLYLFAGGYRATSLSDFIQGCIMLVGIVLMVIFVVRGAGVDPVTGERGGLVAALAQMGKIGGEGFNSVWGVPGKGLDLISLMLLTSLGTWGLPQMMHKFFAIRDEGAVKQATVISTAFCLIVAGSAYFMGAFGKQILGGVLPEGGLDRVMPNVFTSALVAMPDALLGLVIVLVLSASVSTLTALVLASASTIAVDLGGALFPKMEQKTTTRVMRWLCVAFVAISLVIAFGMQGTPIVTLMAFSWGSLAGAFLAPFLYGLFWKGVTRAGVWAGMIGGIAISVLLPNVGLGINTVVSGTLAMLGSLVIVPVVSLLTPKTKFSRTLLETVFKAQA